MNMPTKKTQQLNNKEVAILRQCAEAPATLKEMAKRFRRADDDAQRNSWARNSVRKPVRLGLLKKQKRGTYALTAKGSKLVAEGGIAA
jgi:DNA-binding PadR family transcriptional regulator